jgi:membrane associated rhomboid family serine protease
VSSRLSVLSVVQSVARMDHAFELGSSAIRRAFTEKPWVLLAWPAVAMVAGTLARWLMGKASQHLAIVPRTPGGLVGLVTAPFLHGGFAHLVANLPPFVVLGLLVLRKGSERFVETSAIVALGSGVLVWLFARRGAHMGASAVVFGYLGYLLGLGYFARTTSDLLVAAVVLFFYGGILVGLKPARRETSWEGHLFGLLVGVAKVWVLGR